MSFALSGVLMGYDLGVTNCRTPCSMYLFFMVTFYLKLLDVDVLVNFECKRFILQVRPCTAFKGDNKLIDKETL